MRHRRKRKRTEKRKHQDGEEKTTELKTKES